MSEDITVVGINELDIDLPENTGHRGWARHDVPIRLSAAPPAGWSKFFAKHYNLIGPSLGQAPQVRVQGDRIVLQRTTLERVRSMGVVGVVQRAAAAANKDYRAYLADEAAKRQAADDDMKAREAEARRLVAEINEQVSSG